MNVAERDFLLHKIISGVTVCGVEEQIFFLKPTTPLVKYYAAKVYKDALYEAQLNRLYNDEQIIDILQRDGLWSFEEETKLKKVEKDIEDMKVKLYELTFRSNQRKVVKGNLVAAKQELLKLLSRRGILNHVTDTAVAHLAKIHYIVAHSLVDNNNNTVIKDYDEDCYIIDETLRICADSYITEAQYRDLVQHEPWLSYWMSGRDNIFPKSSTEWTDEQRQIIIWSKFYDSLKENPDCPSDEVIADDDMLDGWCILQKRKRDSEQIKRELEGKLSDKVSQAGEIFIPADTIEDHRRISSLNDVQGQIIKKQKFDKIRREGTVKELDMPEVRQKIVMEANQRWAEHSKKG